MRRMVLSAVLAAVVLVASTPASAREGGSSPGSYRPPVDAPVSDPFRPPPEPWASGNRGVEYATTPGTQVRAAAGGEVVFAGAVAGGLHVVILHPDGVRTSYSFLQSVAVHRGDRVEQGRLVGTSGERLHFGARVGDVYIDPAQLFDQGPPEVFLVPDEVRRPGNEERERKGLLEMLQGLGGDLLQAGADGLEWARDNGGAAVEWIGETAIASEQWAWDRAGAKWDRLTRQVRTAWHYARLADPLLPAKRFVRTLSAWWQQRRSCTSADVATPTPGKGRVAVLVSGFGSKSGAAAIYDVNTLALGYHPADVVRFSYKGGTPAEHRFTAEDTTVDIRDSARRLHELIERTAVEHPGMPIDILAHSQGGLVTRAMLAYEFDRSPVRPPVNAVVTLATPHQGSDLATAGTILQETVGGQALSVIADGISHYAMDGPSFRTTSVHQMSEESRFIRSLNKRPLPAGLRATSIGARTDWAVPAGRTRLAGAHNVTVPVLSGLAHDRLPGSEQAYREIALGLDGRPPSCQSLPDMLFDTAVSESISHAEDSAGAVLWHLMRKTGPWPTSPDDPGGER